MKNRSLNIKIIAIFLIPAIALIYFSFYLINSKYETLTESSKYKLSANITNQLSKLVHNLQIERGLSAGYLVAKDKASIEKELFSQYKKTDGRYKEVLDFINLQSEIKEEITKELGHKNIPSIKKLIYLFSNLNDIRTNVQNLTISYEDEISYYTQINSNLISSIESFVLLLQKQGNDGRALAKLQNLKENAGLERVFIYKQLLENKIDIELNDKISRLQEIQKAQKKEFILEASISSTLIYAQFMNDKELKELDRLRDSFKNSKLSSADAKLWFTKTTHRINNLEDISSNILKVYVNKANRTHSNSLTSLYIAATLWLLSLISLGVLTYILKKLLKKETSLVEELRILAFTFDSHEAITITDVEGTIIKVNSAFTTITGYSKEEVVGKNPRILKSMKHSQEFYQEMWRQLHADGKWSDEIYNTRKNGEVYPERLSITAIKDDNNVTTHYIAQFLDISDLKEAQETAEHQADHDFLTGLANRKQLTQRLHEEFVKARRHNFLHAFLFIDLDNFKKVNDTYGHKVGDSLLQEVTATLKSMVREEDFIARMSGDEFAILILNIDKEESEAAKGVKEICHKILKKLSEPLIIDTHKVNIGASIGIKLFPDGEKNRSRGYYPFRHGYVSSQTSGKKSICLF